MASNHRPVVTLALLALHSLTYAEILHVRPTPSNAPCPVLHCHTLSEYAQDHLKYFNDLNTTLLFLPGDHNLGMNITIESIQQLNILGNSSALMRTRIVCIHVGFTIRNISEVRIDGLVFISCARRHIQSPRTLILSLNASMVTLFYGFYLESCLKTQITNCTFQNSFGSALGLVGSYVILTGKNIFLNNCRRCTPWNCSRKCFGGGVSAENSSLSFNGSSIFNNNLAYIGGGISARINSHVSFIGSTVFIGNSATRSGGGISIGVIIAGARRNNIVQFYGNTTFISNSARYGGGMCTFTTMERAEFSGNTIFSGNSADYGGGLLASSNAKFKFSGNTIFNGNSGHFGGGALNVDRNNNIQFIGNTTFSGNSGRFGGAMNVGMNSSTNFSGNINFSGNSGHSGGGINAGYTSVRFSGNTTFSDNSATYGGGIRIHNSVLKMEGNKTFKHCSASADGGVMYASTSYVSFSGTNVITTNRAAGLGGGIFATNSSLNLSGDNVFNANIAAGVGGGIYATNSSLSLPGTNIFNANTAERGGGIYATMCGIVSNGAVTFNDNTALLDGGGMYMDNSSGNFNGNTTVRNNTAELGGGIYLDRSTLCINGSGVVKNNFALYYGGGLFGRRISLSLAGNNTFLANSAWEGGGIYATANSTLGFGGMNTFKNNTANVSGGGIWMDSSSLNMNNYNQFIDCTAQYEGGAMYSYAATLKLSKRSLFRSNFATRGGGLSMRWCHMTFTSSSVSSFRHNWALTGGGIFTDNSTLDVAGNNSFFNNSASYSGGGMYAVRTSLNLQGNNYFESNCATRDGGGVYIREISTINLSGTTSFLTNSANRGGGILLEDSILTTQAKKCPIYATNCKLRQSKVANTFKNNSAPEVGGGIAALNSSVTLMQNSFEDNSATNGGGLYTFGSTLNFQESSTYSNNSARIVGGGVSSIYSRVYMNGSITFKMNSAVSGGGIYLEDSILTLTGKNCFENHMAHSEGGVIHVRGGTINFSGTNTFMSNIASMRGGSVYAICTTLIFSGNNLMCNSESMQGAAIYAHLTMLIFEGQGSSTFLNNSAQYGGGIHAQRSNVTFSECNYSLQAGIAQPPTSKCETCQHATVEIVTKDCVSNFISNTALQGGALYLDQYSNISLDPTTHVHFQDNLAKEFGGAIYVVDVPGPGQYLPRQNTPFRSECFFHILGEEGHYPDLETSPLVFENNSARSRGNALYGGLLDKCTFTSRRYPNALDLFNNSVMQEGNKHHVSSYISSDPTQLCFCSTDTDNQNCTEVFHSRNIFPGQSVVVSVIAVDQSRVAIPTLIHASIYSGEYLNVSETISYDIEGNCTSRTFSVTPMNSLTKLILYPSNVSGDTTQLTVNITFWNCPIGFQQSNYTGECICDHRLWQFTNTCNIDTQSILRPGGANGSFWLGVFYNNTNPAGFILHRNCPLDYCIRESKYISLNNPDQQCSFNRSDLLCGKCRVGLSLLLGSSQCKRCSNKYLALLFPFALAGILLVILLLILHLTVAAGTLHGLIFYANIVSENRHIFFPQVSNNPASIFISWLNFDLGIQTCFYDGMDAYARTWLQFVFPIYIWGIVGFLVFISDRSPTATKLLGSSPVPVLATLFFLSYGKILRTIIAALSFTILHYPHSSEMVWAQDPNISRMKYIPLVLVALLFLLLLFLPYTLLLLLGQWLQPVSHFRILAWANNPRLKAILDSYHAPYKPEHCYWTGLLLLFRCGLFLVFAFNVTGNDSVNLLAVSSTTTAILLLFNFWKVYKSKYLNVLELSFILNLSVLAVSTYHISLSGGSQTVVTYISVCVAFLTFLGILVYHICVRIKSKVQYIQRGHQLHNRNNQCHDIVEDSPNPENADQENLHPNAPTRSVIEFNALRSPLDLIDT